MKKLCMCVDDPVVMRGGAPTLLSSGNFAYTFAVVSYFNIVISIL